MAERRKATGGGLPAFVFEPIDWNALVEKYRDQSRRTRKGDKRPLEEVEKAKAAKRANRKRRFAEAVKRNLKNAPRPLRPKKIEMIFGVLEPGCWYASVDVARHFGRPSRWAAMAFCRMAEYGFLERAKNSEAKPHAYRKGAPIQVQAQRDPAWLWRLTEAGERRKAALAAERPAGVALAHERGPQSYLD